MNFTLCVSGGILIKTFYGRGVRLGGGGWRRAMVEASIDIDNHNYMIEVYLKPQE